MHSGELSRRRRQILLFLSAILLEKSSTRSIVINNLGHPQDRPLLKFLSSRLSQTLLFEVFGTVRCFLQGGLGVSELLHLFVDHAEVVLE